MTTRANIEAKLISKYMEFAKHTASLKRMIEEVRLTTGDCYAYA